MAMIKVEHLSFAYEESKKVSETGLMMWRVNGAEGEPGESFSFKTSHQYLSAGRDPGAFGREISSFCLNFVV